MSEKQLPAIVVYSDLWRSNQARFLSNYMPYFNRALLIVPADQQMTLLCGLSPRVYGWIRSVTTIEDVRPAGNFAKTLSQLVSERQWTRIGILDFRQFPNDLSASIRSLPVEILNVDSPLVTLSDDTERSMRRKTATLAREILAAELPGGVGLSDFEFVGRLERQFRRAGAEDLIVLLANGKGFPTSATGQILEENYSVSLALEYRGHWARISRAHGLEGSPQWLIQNDPSEVVENLGGSYPYECVQRSDLRIGSICAIHVERQIGASRLFYGDTCVYGSSVPELL
jgi:hypothetical protein